MAIYGIREVRASERVNERVDPDVESECLFIGQSAQLFAIKNDTVAHGYTGQQDGDAGGRWLICMRRTMSHLHARCMQMDGA